jgi:hypothetical protein
VAIFKKRQNLKYLTTLFLLLLKSISSFGQSFDTIKVLNTQANVHEYFICIKDHDKNGQRIPRNLEDSLNNCSITNIYYTNYENIYYQKTYNLFGQLREEGFGKKKWNDRKFLGLKFKSNSFTIIKDGQWKFYDNHGYKRADCCYRDGQLCSGCLWQNYDIKGNKIEASPVFIDH